jgi:hypothetical protein
MGRVDDDVRERALSFEYPQIDLGESGLWDAQVQAGMRYPVCLSAVVEGCESIERIVECLRELIGELEALARLGFRLGVAPVDGIFELLAPKLGA